MGTEKEVSKKIELYQDLAEKNKNIDAASLMISALAQAQQEEIGQRKKRRAYLISIGVPPLGLFYALYYYFSEKSDGKRVALLCVIFTAISIGIALLIGSLMFSSAGVDTNAVQNVNIEDVRRLLQ